MENERFNSAIAWAKSLDRLSSKAIILVDLDDNSFPYISSKITRILGDKVLTDNSFLTILGDRNVKQIDNILYYYSVLIASPSKWNTMDSVLHTDLEICALGYKYIIHMAATPLHNVDSYLHFVLCNIGLSSRTTAGNTLVQFMGEHIHLVLNNGIWEERANHYLTHIEQIVLKHSTNGDNIKEISDKLCLSESTIKSHRHRIFRKLGVKNITEAILYAEDYNLFDRTLG